MPRRAPILALALTLACAGTEPAADAGGGSEATGSEADAVADDDDGWEEPEAECYTDADCPPGERCFFIHDGPTWCERETGDLPTCADDGAWTTRLVPAPEPPELVAPQIADVDEDGRGEVFLRFSDGLRFASLDPELSPTWHALDLALEQPAVAALGRFDADEHLDVLVTGTTGSHEDGDFARHLVLLLGTGTLVDNFAVAIEIEPPTGEGSTAERFVDLDGDGWIDGLGRTSQFLEPFLNDRAGTLVAVSGVAVATDNQACVTDVDGDGLTDLLGATEYGSELALGRGDGSFDYAGVVHTGGLPVCWASDPGAPALTLLQSQWDESTHVVHTVWDAETETLTDSTWWFWSGGGALDWVRSDDLDGDGLADLALDPADPQIWPGADGLSCKVVVVPDAQGPTRGGLGDLDGDGRPELVVVEAGLAGFHVVGSVAP